MTAGVCDGLVQASGGTVSLTVPVIPNVSNKITVCARARIGAVNYGSAVRVDVTVYPWVDPGAPTVTTGYRVSSTCEGSGMWCSTGVTPPEIDLLGLPLGALAFFSFDGAAATTDFTTMPIGSPVSVDEFRVRGL